MKTWSFYRPDTGMFLSRKFSGSDHHIELNTPRDTVAIEGNFDHLSQRVDLATGDVVDYQPPAPEGDEHEWSELHRRWVLKPEVIERRERRSAALRAIEDLEAQQLRPLRELALDPGDDVALDRVGEIDDRIAELRRELK